MGLAELGFQIRFENYTARLGAVERLETGDCEAEPTRGVAAD